MIKERRTKNRNINLERGVTTADLKKHESDNNGSVYKFRLTNFKNWKICTNSLRNKSCPNWQR